MRPDTRQTVIYAAMLAVACAVLMAIILMGPAVRVAREPAAQSAALSATATQAPAHR